MNVMKLITTIARYLLGLIFVVFGLNFWLQFLTVPLPARPTSSSLLVV